LNLSEPPPFSFSLILPILSHFLFSYSPNTFTLPFHFFTSYHPRPLLLTITSPLLQHNPLPQHIIKPPPSHSHNIIIHHIPSRNTQPPTPNKSRHHHLTKTGISKIMYENSFIILHNSPLLLPHIYSKIMCLFFLWNILSDTRIISRFGTYVEWISDLILNDFGTYFWTAEHAPILPVLETSHPQQY